MTNSRHVECVEQNMLFPIAQAALPTLCGSLLGAFCHGGLVPESLGETWSAGVSGGVSLLLSLVMAQISGSLSM